MRVIAYLRVSTDQQVDGNGLSQQRQSICAFAAIKGLRIDEWVQDDETGTTEDRDGIQSLLARAEMENGFTLVFDRIDRLGRTLEVCESLYRKFRERGVELLCASQQLDDTSPAGRMMRQMMGAIAEYQRSEMLARLAQCKRAAKAKRGAYGGGTVAYGYRSVGGGKLAVDDSTVRLVRRAHEEAATPGASLRHIADRLNAEGFRTRKGTLLSAEQIRRILRREMVYTGKKNFGSVELDPGVKPQHDPILEVQHA